MELMWLAARSPRKRWARRVRALRKRGSQTRANAEGAGLQKGRAIHSERGLNARGVCSRVVVVNVAEVDRRRRTQRSVRSRISPDLRSVRGRGSRPQPASGRESAARRLRAKGRRGPGRSGNPSRDRTRDWFRLAQERGRLLSIEGTSDCSGWPHLHGAAGWRSLGDPTLVRKRSDGEWGGDRGVRGSVRPEVRGRRTPRANPDGPPKRIGRRETLDSPVSWVCVQVHGSRAKRKLRRDAGNR
jgi:hypothetical protein